MSSDPLDTIDLEMELPEEVIFGGEKETEAAGSAGGRPSGPANEKVRGPELEAESDDEEFHPIPSPRRNRKRAAAATGVDMDFNSNLLSEEQEEDNEMAGDVESSSDEEGHKGRNHEVKKKPRNEFDCVGDEDKDSDGQSFVSENPLENPPVDEGSEGFDALAPVTDTMTLGSEAQAINSMSFALQHDRQSSLLDVWLNNLPLIPGSDKASNKEQINPNKGDVQNGSPQDEMSLDNGSSVDDIGSGDDFRHDDLEEDNKASVTVGNQRKPGVSKEHAFIDVRGTDWNDKENRYDRTESEKTLLKDETIERWSERGRNVIPSLSYETEDYAEFDYKYLDLLLDRSEEGENNDQPIPAIFRYFLDHKRNVM